MIPRIKSGGMLFRKPVSIFRDHALTHRHHAHAGRRGRIVGHEQIARKRRGRIDTVLVEICDTLGGEEAVVDQEFPGEGPGRLAEGRTLEAYIQSVLAKSRTRET